MTRTVIWACESLNGVGVNGGTARRSIKGGVTVTVGLAIKIFVLGTITMTATIVRARSRATIISKVIFRASTEVIKVNHNAITLVRTVSRANALNLTVLSIIIANTFALVGFRRILSVVSAGFLTGGVNLEPKDGIVARVVVTATDYVMATSSTISSYGE